MAANADDLSHYYAEHIGVSVIVAVTDTAGGLAAALAPGRYRLSTLNVVGATELWINQGPFDADVPVKLAVAAAPSAPIDLAEDPRQKLEFMVRPAGKGAGAARKATDGLSFITDAGTVDVVLTRISREV